AAILLVLQRREVMHLPRHRPETAHLEHQPLQHRDPCPQVRWHEAAGLLGEVEEDGAGFEDADRLAPRAVPVHDRRDLVVRADREELRRELLVAGDVDDAHLVGQAHLLEGHADLASVGRIPGVQFDAHRPRRGSMWTGDDNTTHAPVRTGARTGTISRPPRRPSGRATAHPRVSPDRQLLLSPPSTSGHALAVHGERPEDLCHHMGACVPFSHSFISPADAVARRDAQVVFGAWLVAVLGMVARGVGAASGGPAWLDPGLLPRPRAGAAVLVDVAGARRFRRLLGEELAGRPTRSSLRLATPAGACFLTLIAAATP